MNGSLSKKGPAQLKKFKDTLVADGWKMNGLDNSEFVKTFTWVENTSRWRLSSTTRIQIVNAKLSLKNSRAIIDAPKDMLIDMFPNTQSAQIIPDTIVMRRYVPLEYAFDETPYISLRTSGMTLWSRFIIGLRWCVTGGLKWLLGVLFTLAGGIIVARLDKIKKLFEHDKGKEVGFGAGHG